MTRFTKTVQPEPCHGCGKNTTGIGSTYLCRKCYDEAGLINAHSDGDHDDRPDPDCPNCAAAPADPSRNPQ